MKYKGGEQQPNPFGDEPAQNEQPFCSWTVSTADGPIGCQRKEGHAGAHLSGPIHKTFAQSLAELRVALEAKTIGCTGHPHAPQQGCKPCAESDPDPAFAPLLALAREKCPHRYEFDGDPCPGFITRTAYWQAAPKGALRGALEEALPNSYSLHRYGTNTEVWETVAGSITNVAGAFGTDDMAALEAVREWVKGI